METIQGKIGEAEVVSYFGPLTPELALSKVDGIRWVATNYAAEMARAAEWDMCDGERARLLISQLPFLLEHSKIIIWKGDLWEASRRGGDVFVGTASRETNQTVEPQYWQWDGDHGWNNDLVVAKWFDLEGRHIVDGYIVMAIVTPSGKRGLLVGVVFNPSDVVGLPVVRYFPAIHEGEKIPKFPFLLEVFSGLEFMRLKLVAVERALLPRSTRRRMAREDKPIPDIRIIQLRARESSGEGAQGSREYHHQWIVKGHWRRLHQPRKEDGAEVTFVSAYVKGPDHAPLLQPRKTVFTVER